MGLLDAQIRDSISEAAPSGDTSKSSPETWLWTLEAQRWPLTQGSEMDLRYKPPSPPHRQGSPPLGSPPSRQQSDFTEHCLHWASVSSVSMAVLRARNWHSQLPENSPREFSSREQRTEAEQRYRSISTRDYS